MPNMSIKVRNKNKLLQEKIIHQEDIYQQEKAIETVIKKGNTTAFFTEKAMISTGNKPIHKKASIALETVRVVFFWTYQKQLIRQMVKKNEYTSKEKLK